MNILITRPLIDSEDLMEKLFSLNHRIIHLPTLKISPNKFDTENLSRFDAFIFTSANAIRNLNSKNLDKTKPCFCVGSITEKIARTLGFQQTISAGGTVNALKNLIINSNLINDQSKLAYFCGDNISYNLDQELNEEGLKISKIINYVSEKITNLNDKSKKIILDYPPDIIFVYSSRSAQSLMEIAKNYSLLPLMTGSKVMCISDKVLNVFKKAGWKNLEVFEPGNELLKLQ